MSHFYAEFGMNGSPPVRIRKETRVYFQAQDDRRMAEGRCRGVIWTCNPSVAGVAAALENKSIEPMAPTASPNAASTWGSIGGDAALYAVERLLRCAGARANAAILSHDYVSMRACFYSCDYRSEAAFKRWIASSCDYTEAIPNDAQFILAAWGSDKPYGLVMKSMSLIKASGLPVFFHDPLINPPRAVSKNLETMWFPAHPLNPSFAVNLEALAMEMSRYL